MGIGFFEVLILALLLLSGSSNLEETLDVERFWDERGVEITVDNLMAELTAPPNRGDEVRTWVEQLGAASFDDREKAEHQLREAGFAAQPFLENATQSRDPEIRMRAKRILEGLPEKVPGQDHLRARMAVVTLSRMEDVEAQQRFHALAGEEGPMAEMAKQILDYRKSFSGEEADRFPLVPGDAPALIHFQAGRGGQDSSFLREIRASPGIQSQLRKLWARVGHVRIREITASFSPSNSGMPPQGTAALMVQGQFEPGKIHPLLAAAGFSPDQTKEFWEGKKMILRVEPDGTGFSAMGVFSDEDRAPSSEDLTALLEKGRRPLPEKTMQSFPVVPGSLIRVAVPIPESMMLIPGIPVQPEAVTFRLGVDDDTLKFKWDLPFPEEQDAMEMLEYMQTEIDRSKALLSEENSPEIVLFQDILSSMRLAAEGRQFQVWLDVPENTRIALVRQVERMMSMMMNLRNQNLRMMNHRDIQIIH